VHCSADLQSVHGFRCYDNTAQKSEREMSASARTYSLYGWLFAIIATATARTVQRLATACDFVFTVEMPLRCGCDQKQTRSFFCELARVAANHDAGSAVTKL